MCCVHVALFMLCYVMLCCVVLCCVVLCCVVFHCVLLCALSTEDFSLLFA